MKPKATQRTKPKQIKARRMWACMMGGRVYSYEKNYENAAYHLCDTPLILRDKRDRVVPMVAIDISDPEALVVQAANAVYRIDAGKIATNGDVARAVLTALSILHAKKGRK